VKDAEQNLVTPLPENAILSEYLYIIISRLTQYFLLFGVQFKDFCPQGNTPRLILIGTERHFQHKNSDIAPLKLCYSLQKLLKTEQNFSTASVSIRKNECEDVIFCLAELQQSCLFF